MNPKIQTYTLGDVPHLEADFIDLTGTLVDPTTVSLIVEDPAGTQTTYTYNAAITKDSTGKYHKDLTGVAQVGAWNYRWVSTGVGKAALEGKFIVQPTAFS